MDYNIYIHNVNGFNAPTGNIKAWQSSDDGGSQTKAWITSGSQDSNSNNESKGTPPFNVGKAALNMAKSHPVLAAAIAVVVIADKIITTVEPFVSRDTGDYRFGIWYNNAKNGFMTVLKPISTVIENMRMQQEIYHTNKKNEQERLLLGDAYLNRNSQGI